MSHKKAGGSSKNGRDSVAKRRGIKLFGGEVATAGSIIVRQQGNMYRAGRNVGMGRDYTLYAEVEGVVGFEEKRRARFDGKIYRYTYVVIDPVSATPVKAVKAVKPAKEEAVVTEEVEEAPAKPVAAKKPAVKKAAAKPAAAKKPAAKKA